MTIGHAFLFIGVLAVLGVMFYRSSGFAVIGSVLTLGLAVTVLVLSPRSSLPELLGLLYLAAAVAIWVASPPAEEVAEPIGGSMPGKERTPIIEVPPGTAPPVVAPRRQTVPTELTALDHVWLAGLPLLGFVVSFFAVNSRVAFQEGLYYALASGTPGREFAFAISDIGAVFGLIFLFPVGKLILMIPVSGVVCVFGQFLRGRPTAFAAAVEFGLLFCILNIVILAGFPLKL